MADGTSKSDARKLEGRQRGADIARSFDPAAPAMVVSDGKGKSVLLPPGAQGGGGESSKIKTDVKNGESLRGRRYLTVYSNHNIWLRA